MPYGFDLASSRLVRYLAAARAAAPVRPVLAATSPPMALPAMPPDAWKPADPLALPGRVNWRGFEGGVLPQWAAHQFKPGAVTLFHDPVKGPAARFEVGPGDDPIRSGGERAEVSGPKGAVMEKKGTEAWYAWSTRFPAGFVPTPKTYHNIFTQFHGSSGGGAPNLSLLVNTTGPVPMLALMIDGNDTHHTPEHRIDLVPLERGRWYDFKLHVKWAEDHTGLVELWIDGKPVVTGLRTPTLFRGEDAYLKLGFYRGNHDQRTVVEHAGMRRSAP